MSKDIKKEKSTKEKAQSSYQKEKDGSSKELTDNVFRKKKKQAIEKVAYFLHLHKADYFEAGIQSGLSPGFCSLF